MIVKSLPINPVHLEFVERILIVHVDFTDEIDLSPIYRTLALDHMHFIRDFKAFAGSAPGILEAFDNKKSLRYQQLME